MFVGSLQPRPESALTYFGGCISAPTAIFTALQPVHYQAASCPSGEFLPDFADCVCFQPRFFTDLSANYAIKKGEKWMSLGKMEFEAIST
jgi:hypothetical protein